DALAKVPGVADAYLTGAQAQTGNVYQFNVQLQITSAVLGGKYTPKPTTKAGGH
ncbi:MAG: hypothetical protein JO147_01860, partial [Actinobacteria bacterium]|nr:hypothetical protein [Actinomycetota bacterium]